MTKNFADQERYIAVEGLDKALEVAKVLLKNDYEVFMECDDCDIWCVHYNYAKYKQYSNASFYRISDADAALLEAAHDEQTKEDSVDDTPTEEDDVND